MTEPGENIVPEQAREPKVTAGERLRVAREARNITQQDIAARLRLKIEVIQALEQDQYERLEAPIFVRGYIRSYAMQLGLAPEEVIEAFNQVVGVPETPNMMKQPHVGKIKTRKVATAPGLSSILISAVILVVLVGVVWWYLQDGQKQEQPGSTVKPESTVLPAEEKKPEALPETRPDNGGTSTLPIPPVTPPEGNTSSVDPVKPAPVPAPVKEKIETPPVAKPVEEKPPVQRPVSSNTGEQIIVRCSVDSWVEVRDANGKRLIYRLVKAGETVEVTGKAPFNLLLGNAGGITLELNGEPYDFSRHIRGKVARFRLDKQ